MNTLTFSIVICTYNRADLLRGAIESVLRQDFPKDEYELLIIDNASSDQTSEIGQEFCEAYPNVRYVMETNVGLSHARNRGWQESKGEYVGYLDDDGKASSEWLSNALRVATEIQPEAFGGPYFAFYNSPKPDWFKDEYASYVQCDSPRALMENEYLRGGNMFIRHDVLQNLAGFNSELGMKGEKIAYGEETHFFNRLLIEAKNAVLYYDPSIFIYHLVRPEKMKITGAIKRYYIAAKYSYRASNSHATSRIKAMINILVACFKLSAGAFRMFARDKKQYPHWQNYVYEVLCKYVAQISWHSASFFSDR
jgi:glycosyltransferase involved in cell wall biosynthesis